MKNKTIRLVALVSALVMSTATFTACGSESHEHPDPLYNGKSWEEVVALCQQAYTERASAVSEQERLRAELAAYTNGSDGSNKAAISVTGDGTNRMTFNSNDSKIIFPSSFEFPGSAKAPSTGSISIVENVEITPGANWIQRSSGATLDLEHTSGISGTIKIGQLQSITGYYNYQTLKADILEPWAAGLPLSVGVSYGDITASNSSIGCAASTPTLIDSENAVLKFGMFSVQDLTVTYVFVYRGTQDVSKDESITNLLNSIRVYGTEIQIDQY